jgi:hypothetical protein
MTMPLLNLSLRASRSAASHFQSVERRDALALTSMAARSPAAFEDEIDVLALALVVVGADRLCGP